MRCRSAISGLQRSRRRLCCVATRKALGWPNTSNNLRANHNCTLRLHLSFRSRKIAPAAPAAQSLASSQTRRPVRADWRPPSDRTGSADRSRRQDRALHALGLHYDLPARRRRGRLYRRRTPAGMVRLLSGSNRAADDGARGQSRQANWRSSTRSAIATRSPGNVSRSANSKRPCRIMWRSCSDGTPRSRNIFSARRARNWALANPRRRSPRSTN